MTANPAPSRGPRVVFEDDVWADGFTQIPNTFIRCKGLDPETKMVLITLLSYGFRQDEIPDQQELASALNRSPRWMWAKLKELEQRNIIEVKRVGLHQPNEYVIRRFHNWNIDTVIPDSHASANQTRTRLRIIDWKASANQGSHASASPNKAQDNLTKIDTKIDQDGGANAPAPPPSDSPKKERKPSLKSAEPEIYAKRERLKAHWLTLKGQSWDEIPDSKQKYMLMDLEHLARHFDESDVTTVMDLAWNEQWSNGTHPARRTTYRLTDLADKIAAWRHGDWPEKPRPVQGKAGNTVNGFHKDSYAGMAAASRCEPCPECEWRLPKHAPTCSQWRDE